MKFNSRACTLVEIMIVVAITGILATIAIPNFIHVQQFKNNGGGITYQTAKNTGFATGIINNLGKRGDGYFIVINNKDYLIPNNDLNQSESLEKYNEALQYFENQVAVRIEYFEGRMKTRCIHTMRGIE